VEDTDFSDEFCGFIRTAIPSVDAAEVLLLLYRDPSAVWSPRQAVARLPAGIRANEADAAKYLQLFESSGLALAAPDRGFQFHPANEALATHVRTLAQAYEERPVTLIRLIYALRDSKIRSFAEAFKLRKP
jgi:hypothetical protein